MDIAIIGTTKPEKLWYDTLMGTAQLLASYGFFLRTGGALGIDEACMKGVAAEDPSKLEVYLPWKSYKGGDVPLGCNKYIYREKDQPSWAESVDLYHPNPDALSFGARSLHARNYGIVCHGKPVDLVLALPKSFTDWGGTGQGMRIAEELGIPVLNLRDPEDIDKYRKLMQLLEDKYGE